MIFNISFDASVGSAPSLFRTVVNAVAQFFQNAYSDNVTVNINVGYGEIGGQTVTALGQSSTFLNIYTYDQVSNALLSDAKTADDSAAVSTLPGTSPLGGATYWVARAEAKALGLLGASASTDGSVGFSSSANIFDYDRSDGISAGRYDFYAVVAHEFSEVMGRQLMVSQTFSGHANSLEPMDLFHYASLGNRIFTGTEPGYFSLDGGKTSLNSFNTNPAGDFGDWAATAGNDAFLAFGNPGVIGAITEPDLRVMDAIGWDRAGAATPGSISINDVAVSEGDTGTKTAIFTVTRTGGTTAFDVNFATADGSATVADNDYGARSGIVHFGANVTTQTVSITINGDTKVELDETFFVNLSAATNGVTISDSSGTGTITNDDALAGSLLVAVDTDHFGNFDGDSTDDFLWRDSDGSVGIWQMSSGGPTGLNVEWAPLDWHIEGTGDFNGDHRSDILWRNDSGAVGEWQMNGASAVPVNVGTANLDWHIKGLGDFNGDGRSDILWRNDNGAVGEWQMNGSSAAPINLQPVGLDWHIVGIGDFNADGRDDILWRSDGGTVGAWLMNGATFTPVNLGTATPDGHIVGMADFNADGRTDVLWRSDNGIIGEWLIGAGGSVTASNLGTVGADWHVAATGDVNGDTFDDVVWRNDNGAVGEWLMHGNAVTPQNLPTVDAVWMVSGHHFDFV